MRTLDRLLLIKQHWENKAFSDDVILESIKDICIMNDWLLPDQALITLSDNIYHICLKCRIDGKITTTSMDLIVQAFTRMEEMNDKLVGNLPDPVSHE